MGCSLHQEEDLSNRVSIYSHPLLSRNKPCHQYRHRFMPCSCYNVPGELRSRCGSGSRCSPSNRFGTRQRLHARLQTSLGSETNQQIGWWHKGDDTVYRKPQARGNDQDIASTCATMNLLSRKTVEARGICLKPVQYMSNGPNDCCHKVKTRVFSLRAHLEIRAYSCKNNRAYTFLVVVEESVQERKSHNSEVGDRQWR